MYKLARIAAVLVSASFLAAMPASALSLKDWEAKSNRDQIEYLSASFARLVIAVGKTDQIYVSLTNPIGEIRKIGANGEQSVLTHFDVPGFGPLGLALDAPAGTLRSGRFRITVDRDFAGVIRGCGLGRAEGTWITPEMIHAYEELHRLGYAHSIEAWTTTPVGDMLAGGLYGVAIAGLFAAESKFHRVTDASKVALAALVDILREGGASLLDVQWTTPHLTSLGARDVSREEYLQLLERALARPLPAAFGGP